MEIVFELGRTYLMRNGGTVTITDCDKDGHFYGHTNTGEGSYGYDNGPDGNFVFYHKEHPEDVVKGPID